MKLERITGQAGDVRGVVEVEVQMESSGEGKSEAGMWMDVEIEKRRRCRQVQVRCRSQVRRGKSLRKFGDTRLHPPEVIRLAIG